MRPQPLQPGALRAAFRKRRLSWRRSLISRLAAQTVLALVVVLATGFLLGGFATRSSTHLLTALLLSAMLLGFTIKSTLGECRRLLAPLSILADPLALQSSTTSHQLPVRRQDEIGAISRSLVRLRRTEEQVRIDLERRMAARTRDLAATQARLACILESMLDLVYSLSLDQKKVLYVSPAAYAILGANESELYANPKLLVSLCHPDDIARVREARQKVLDGCMGEVQYRIIRPDHEVRWMLDRFYLVFDADGNASHIDGIVTDITMRINAEQARAEAEILLRLKDRALASSMNGVVIADMRKDHHPVIYVNPAFERMTGYTLPEVLGTNCRFLQRDDGDQPGLAEIREAIAAGREVTVQLRNYRKDGTLFWNELSISPVHDPVTHEVTHYIGIQNDVTLKRESEQRLFEWFVRFETIFTLSPDGFVSFGQDGTITYVNPAFERMLGLTSGDILGLNLLQLDKVLNERADSSEHYHGVLDAVNPVCVPRSDLITLNSPVRRTLQWSARECNAQAASLVMYFRDITREADVDRMKSDFLSTAAHELRTPMASIMGFSELLLARKFNEERTRDMLDTINRQSVRLTSLINELLDLARIESRAGKDFRIEPVDLAGLINEALQSLLVPGDPRAVQAHVPDALPAVSVDARKMQQALTNVLSNAYKYSPNGGEIRLDVLRREYEGHPQIGIRVVDHGIGMTPEQLSHLFERFYRADTSGNIPGTGLGMALVKEIVELHHGKVEVSSHYGEGTVVTLWLPLPEADITLFDSDDVVAQGTQIQENSPC